MYHTAPINQYYQPKLLVEQERATVELKIRPDFYHAAFAVHGSVYFKLLDDAAFFAVNSVVHDVFVLTAQFDIYFLKPIDQGAVMAKGALVYQSKNSFLAEASLFAEDGSQISRGIGSFIRSKILLNEEVGYR
jgi:uncharacterized protein (TIGR00369 family)